MTRQRDIWTAKMSSCYVTQAGFTIVIRMDRDWERRTLIDLDPKSAQSLHDSLGKYLDGISQSTADQNA